MSEDLAAALYGFFTNTEPLPECPKDTPVRTIWYEPRNGWLYPWRIVKFEDDIARGYPCGEPIPGVAS